MAYAADRDAFDIAASCQEYSWPFYSALGSAVVIFPADTVDCDIVELAMLERNDCQQMAIPVPSVLRVACYRHFSWRKCCRGHIWCGWLGDVDQLVFLVVTQ